MRSSGVLTKRIQKVSGSRYISVFGSWTLGQREVRLTVQDATSGTRYKTEVLLDAKSSTQKAAHLLEMVLKAVNLEPNRDSSGQIKKKPWKVTIDEGQLRAVVEVNQEMDQPEHEQKTGSTRRFLAPARQRETEGEFDYFDEAKACPPRRKPPKPRRKRQIKEPVPSAHNLAMRAPRFLPRADDITFKCKRILDSREMIVLAAFRPLEGSITLQAHDPSIDHFWRLVLRTRPPGAELSEDGGFLDLPLDKQHSVLEDLCGNLRVDDSSMRSLGTLHNSYFTPSD